LRFVSVLNQKLKSLLYKRGKGDSKRDCKIPSIPLTKGDQKVTLFDIDTETRSSLKNHTKLVENVSKERIKDEMMKVFIS